MDTPSRKDIEQSFIIAAASSSAGMRGVIGLCNELGKAGLLDERALHRIEDFMLRGLSEGGLSAEAQQVLGNSIKDQFSDLHRRLD